ncbi:MAG: [Fe-S]-binding protein, partial [bacterium]|nr:[Fe-S]-binding protein [bacterium]
MSFRFSIFRCDRGSELKDKLGVELEQYLDLFPKSKSARILLKPNLNSNMNALTGNTTDLRIIAAVISFLQNQGYRNIAIGEGTNSGFYRNKINVITRLMV